jgi:S-adenosylmethionine:diacylglycerol 3-amino-3-carboxypropyl transferase
MPHSDAASPFTILRYAQCWEDADILVDGLDIRPGDTCLSIASAGDNTLSLLTRAPGRVIAFDLNPTQIAALELRVAAYRTLGHGELLELVGSRPSGRRELLYARCRGLLSDYARGYWDGRGGARRNRRSGEVRTLLRALPAVRAAARAPEVQRSRAAAASRRERTA